MKERKGSDDEINERFGRRKKESFGAGLSSEHDHEARNRIGRGVELSWFNLG